MLDGQVDAIRALPIPTSPPAPLPVPSVETGTVLPPRHSESVSIVPFFPFVGKEGGRGGRGRRHRGRRAVVETEGVRDVVVEWRREGGCGGGPGRVEGGGGG
eukprot:3931606-Rhodomonas_salina.1